MADTANTVYRDFETDGVPTSGKRKPKKSEIRRLLTGYETIINAFTSNGGLVFTLRASLDLVLNHPAATMAWVVGDPVAANNGIYQKIGASGAGSWIRVADLPFSFIVASDVGAGTPNAIVATASMPVSESALIILNVFESNTGAATVSFNGGSALTIKTNTGNDVAAGGLVAGMRLLGVISGSTFRLVSDQVSSAIVAAAEDAADRAEAAASLLNYVTGFGSVDLTGAVSAQAVVEAAVEWSYANNTPLFWPDGLYLSTASIPNFHDVQHTGPGVVKRASVGSEIITNGDFAAGATWNVSGTGVSITGGVGRFVGASGYLFYQSFTALTAGKTYRASFTIFNRTSGSIRLRFGVGSAIYESTALASTNGTFSFDVTVSQPVNRVYIDGGPTPTFDIDNISVKEVITDLWYITPAEYGTINHVHAAASGGSSANDGLSASQPIDTFQHAIDAITAWAPLNRGEWQIDLGAGTYARGRFQDAGVPTAYPIIVAGPPVAITGTAPFKISVENRSGSFTNGELITFSTSGATATLTFVDNTRNVLFATLVSGTPFAGQNITGGTSGATGNEEYISPTPRALIKEGATQTGVGILAFNTPLRVRDVEAEDYNGSTSSTGVRIDFQDMYLENFHGTDCYYGSSGMNRVKSDIKGGFFYDCGFLNSTTGGGYGSRGYFHSKFEIGTQSAGTLANGPAYKGCSGTVLGQENTTGHMDFVIQKDNDNGVRMRVNSRLNVDGTASAGNAGPDFYTSQNAVIDTSVNNTYGAGARASQNIYVGGAGCTASALAIDTINTGNASESRVFKSAFPGTVVTSTSSTNTIDSFTLKGGVFHGALATGIAAKSIKLRVYGILTGTTGTFKRVQVRLGAASVGILSFNSGDTGNFRADLEVLFTGPSAQLFSGFALASGLVARGANTTMTESMASDITLALQVYVNNAADSITITGYEWSEVGV